MDKIDMSVSRMIDYALEKPDTAPSRVLVISLSKNSLEKVLTPARMNILREIRESKPQSVGKLAESVKRPLESVSRDLKILENYGLLTFTKTGRTKRPAMEMDMLMIPLKD